MILFPRRKVRQQHRAAYEGVLGTSLEIFVCSDSQAKGIEAEQRILAEIDRLEAVFSVYLADSEFNRWQGTSGEAVAVSIDLATVLAEAERWRAASNGAFLPTVEALTRAWKIREREGGPDEVPLINPSNPMWKVDMDSLSATRLTEHPASLNAIAKGYIVDQSVAVAKDVESVMQVMVNLGGDLVHWGEGGAQVAIADPVAAAENAPPLCEVTIANQAIATSGGYRRGFMIDGIWHSHVFDPLMSMPVTKLRVSSLITKTAMEADCLATILGVLPPHEGMAFIEGFESVGALIVDSDGNCSQNDYWNACRTTVKPKRASLRRKQ